MSTAADKEAQIAVDKEGFPSTQHREGSLSDTGSPVGASHGAAGAAVAPRRARGGKFRRHCAKWWWLHLIIFLGLVLLVVLLMYALLG